MYHIHTLCIYTYIYIYKETYTTYPQYGFTRVYPETVPLRLSPSDCCSPSKSAVFQHLKKNKKMCFFEPKTLLLQSLRFLKFQLSNFLGPMGKILGNRFPLSSPHASRHSILFGREKCRHQPSPHGLQFRWWASFLVHFMILFVACFFWC